MPTALELKRDEWCSYNPSKGTGWLDNNLKIAVEKRKSEALALAHRAVDLLREDFGATKVVIFGSLSRDEWFNPWSDIDLAVWGIRPESFYAAVAAVTGLSSDFKIDLIDAEDCKPSIQQAIERGGIAI